MQVCKSLRLNTKYWGNIMDYENNTNVAPATSSLILEERHDSELFRVYALILDGITDHLLLPGKKLTESVLCRQMVCFAQYRAWRIIAFGAR